MTVSRPGMGVDLLHFSDRHTSAWVGGVVEFHAHFLMTRKRSKQILFHTLLPLLLGGGVYLLFRPGDIGLQSGPAFGLILAHYGHFLPSWLLYTLPDILWAYSFAYFMLWLWNHKLTLSSLPWIIAAMLSCIGWEAGQYTGRIPGTFDPADLLFQVLGACLALLHIKSVNLQKQIST